MSKKKYDGIKGRIINANKDFLDTVFRELEKLQLEETERAYDIKTGAYKSSRIIRDAPIFNTIESLNLSVRVYNTLNRQNMVSVADVLDHWDKFGIEGFFLFPNFGTKAAEELEGKLVKQGFLKEQS